MGMTKTQAATLARIEELGGTVDITYAVKGINRASVEGLATKGLVRVDQHSREGKPNGCTVTLVNA